MKKDTSADSQHRIRLNHKASIARIETVTEGPKVWTVPYDEMAYLLDLTSQKEKLRKPDSEMRSIDSLIRAEVSKDSMHRFYLIFADILFIP